MGDLPESREAQAPEAEDLGGVAVGDDGSTVEGMSLSETPPESWTIGAAEGFGAEGAAVGAEEGTTGRFEVIAILGGTDPPVAALNMLVLDDTI